MLHAEAGGFLQSILLWCARKKTKQYFINLYSIINGNFSGRKGFVRNQRTFPGSATGLASTSSSLSLPMADSGGRMSDWAVLPFVLKLGSCQPKCVIFLKIKMLGLVM